MKKRFDRVLSFGDYFADRWEKARYCGFGEGTSIYDNVLILGDVKIGKNCWVGPNCILDGSGDQLVIGDNCSISAGVQIYTHNTVNWAIRGEASDARCDTGKVFIGNNNYLGPNSVIAMDSRLGDGCVIGSLTFVNGMDIPSGAKVYGSPGQIIS